MAIKIRTFDNEEIITMSNTEWSHACGGTVLDLSGTEVSMPDGFRDSQIIIGGTQYTWYQPLATDTNSLIDTLRSQYPTSGSVVIAEIVS